jgi:putative FmdB family regulatory protein
MPLYEYRCKACGHRFEKIQSFSAPDEKECPLCKGEVERLISAPAVQFKGSGFYSTDYVQKPATSKSTDGVAKDGAPGNSSKDSSSTSSSDSGPKSAPDASSSTSSAAPAASSSSSKE